MAKLKFDELETIANRYTTTVGIRVDEQGRDEMLVIHGYYDRLSSVRTAIINETGIVPSWRTDKVGAFLEIDAHKVDLTGDLPAGKVHTDAPNGVILHMGKAPNTVRIK